MNDFSFFNTLDYIYITIMFISTILGFIKGFTRVFFSLCAWMASGFFAAMLSPSVQRIIKTYFPELHMAQAISIIISYVLILITLLLATDMLSSSIKKSALSELDRTAGALFGLVRGLILPFGVCLLFLLLQLSPNKFIFIKESQISGALFNISSLVLRDFKGREIYKTVENQQKTLRDLVEKSREEAKKISRFPIRSLIKN